MNTQPQFDAKKISIFAGSSLLFIIVISCIWYAATHGVLVVEGEGSYALKKASDEAFERTESETGSRIIESGSYSVEYTGTTASAVKYVEVPSFLRSVTVSFTELTPRHVERMASQTLGSILISTTGSIASVEPGRESDRILRHAIGDPTGLAATVAELQPRTYGSVISNNRLIGFTLVDNEESQVRPTIYDYTSGTIRTTSVAKTYYDSPDTSIIRPSSANTALFGVFYPQDDNTVALDVYNGTSLLTTINTIGDAANASNNRKAIAISDTVIAIGYGAGYEGLTDESAEGRQQAQSTDQYSVRFYAIDNGREIRRIDLGQTSNVAAIHVTRDGTYTAVLDDNQLKVYGKDGGEPVFSYSASLVSDMQWLDNQKLIFSSVDSGLYQLDMSQQSAFTLFPVSKLRISSFDIHEQRLLFTAFANGDTSGTSSPDGYAAYLDRATADDNALITAFPYQNSRFKVASLGDTIYAASNTESTSMRDANGNFLSPTFRPVTTVNQSLRDEVTAYLRENVPNYSQYKLVFGTNL